MFYEEIIINGVLCWRGTPNGEWVQKTPEQLTGMIVELRSMRPVYNPGQKYQQIPYHWHPGCTIPKAT